MQEVCDQCRRPMSPWQKRVINAGRIFCDESCAEDRRLVEANIYALYSRSPT